MDPNTNFVARLLTRRGYDTEEKQRAFLSVSEEDLRDIRTMCQGTQLIRRLGEALDAGEAITIYGDYDADGILASYIYYSGLDRLAPGTIRIFINDRFADGYSMTEESMRKLLAQHPQTRMLLTCDNGISATEAIAYAMARGVTVLVTDHHEQAETLPEGALVLDEKSVAQKEADAAAGTERENFCGAELARRVITALYEEKGLAEKESAFLDSLYAFAGFATITDAVPLTAANHYIGKRGLAEIRKGEGIWRLLAEECRLRGKRISGDTIGFTYGPMINAGGRVTGSATPALRMFLAHHRGEEEACRAAIRDMLALNEARKAMCLRDDETARALIREEGRENDAFLFLYDDSFAEGINGLTAAHLVEAYGVPAAVLSPTQSDPEIYKGSARSVPGFDLFRHLTAHADKIRAGGHPMAAGLRVRKEDLEAVRALLLADAQAVLGDAISIEEVVSEEGEPDLTLAVEDLSLELLQKWEDAKEQLEPFGPDFAPPRVELTATVSRLYGMRGKDGQERHAKFLPDRAAADGCRVEILWWNRIDEARAVLQKKTGLRVIGRPEEHIYNGIRSIQFVIQEVR